MRTLLLITLIVCCLTAGTMAETLTGTVRAATNDKPLEGATVSVNSGAVLLQTDENGEFTVKDVDGPISVKVSHVGYATVANARMAPGLDNVISLQISMSQLNTIVVTANRYEKAAYKVAQPITAANAEEIEAKGHTIVSDIIRDFPGLDMNDAGPFRARPVIRGLYGTRILVLVDGERLNDQRDVSDFAGASMSLIDPNEIERVEVVNGPASVLYGSDAMAGVINIITKKNGFNGTPKPFARYSGRYSTADEQHSNRIDLGVEAERFSASFGVQYREARKDFAPPDDWQSKDDRYAVFAPEFYDALNEDQGTNFSRDRLVNSEARVNNYDAKFGYKISNKHRLDLDFGAFRANDIGYAGVPNAATPFLFFYPNHDRDNFSISYTGNGITKRMARMEARLYYEKISKEFLTDFLDGISIPMGPGMYINPLTSMNETEVTKIGLNFQELYQFSEKTTVTFGIDSYTEKIDGQVTSRTELAGPVGDLPPGMSKVVTETGSSVPRNRWYSLGLYAASELKFDKVQLTVGSRLDHFKVSTEETPGYVDSDGDGAPLPTEDEAYTALNGSLGAVYPIGKNVNVVSHIGTAYQVPNVVEQFSHGSASHRETRPNPDIKPERSVTLDVGIKAVHAEWNYSLMGFWSDYNDFTQLQNFRTVPPSHPGGDSTRLWRYENVEDVNIYGIETMIEANLYSGVYGSLGFTYQHGQNKTDDQPLFVSPVKVSFSSGYRHGEHGLFGEFTIRRVWDQNRIPDVTALDDIATKGFTVVSATAGVTLYKNVRFSITGNNLFDEVYSEPFNGRNPDNPIPEAGRSFVFSLNSSI